MSKRILVILLCMAFLLFQTGCTNSRYHEADFLGKTSIEIEKAFGSFNCTGMPVSADGLYRNTACGYTIREPRTGFLGTEAERLFFIRFDENGIAYGCYEGDRPGG